jgi:DNA gyrase/topoisomerase IV subunit A
MSKRKGTAIRLPISKHIDVNFRDYALYVLNNRGIPSFYDGLTNVQKFILQNSPDNFGKTVSVVGKCISAGYHHGDASLSKAINKLARPFGCANKILDGDGFFGTPINQDAAATRYTSVKINSEIKELIKENSFLNTKNDDGQWNPLWLQIPIGLTTSIVGIAVGYKTTILPRSISDMKGYLDGKIKICKPSFLGFKGKINRHHKSDKSWIIEGLTKTDNVRKTIRVTAIPPMMKYSRFLAKIENIIEPYERKIKILNNSSDNIDLTIEYKGKFKTEFKTLTAAINKATKLIVTETLVFVKDGVVLVYDKIEDYLDDFRYRISELNWRKSEYYFNVTSDELDFQIAKKKYLEFMLKQKHTDLQITKFLSIFPKKIANKLDAIRLRKLSSEELKRTDKKIKELQRTKNKQLKEKTKLFKAFHKLTDPTKNKGTQNRKTKNINLFDESDFGEIDGIEVFELQEDED